MGDVAPDGRFDLVESAIEELEKYPSYCDCGDIMQINPAVDVFGGCMMVVTEVKKWGVQGYVQSAGVDGQQYVRKKWEDIEHTGGKAAWIVR